MIYASQYGGGLPFGSVIRGRDLPSPEYERLDGRTKVRTDNLRLSGKYPIGKLTGTIRTPAASPTAAPVIATANHFVAAGGNTANGIQFSSDAASWATAATAVSTTASALLATATRLIALNSTAQQPAVSATLVPSSVWSATSGGPASVAAGTSLCRGCYSPSLGMALVCSASLVYTLLEGATAWVSRSPTASSTRQGGCWTGAKFILISGASAVINLTADASSWTDSTLPEATSTGQGNIASNGAGLVGVSGSPSGLQVSLDHGDTWRIAQISGLPPSDTWRIQFSGGYFLVPTAKGLAMSTDLLNWQIDPTQVQSLATAVGVAKKGSTIAQVVSGSTTAYSLLESSTEYRLPDVQEFTPSVSGAPTPLDPTFIKAL